MEMENKSFEMDEFREQFKMLTDKMEKQNIVTAELMREVSKRKIRRFEFWRSWIFNILLIIVCILAIYEHCVNDYPAWMLIPYVYMIGLALYAWIVGENNQRKYLKKIDYDVVRYWEDQERKKKYSSKSTMKLYLILLPLIVSGVFNCYYAIANDFKISGVYNILIVIGTIVLAVFVGLSFHKRWNRFLIRKSK